MTTPVFDFYHFDELLNDKQRALRDQVRRYVDEVVWPNINSYWERAEFPREIALGLKELPIIGGMLTDYGCAGLKALEMGLVRAELARGDGSIGTFYGVHSGLAMGSIGLLGSAEQQARWLPEMARLEKIGAFGLTEPERGSDAVKVQTTARRERDYFVLNGSKRWIGNATIADIIIIWARDETGKFGGYILEDPQMLPGVTLTKMEGKITKRAVLNGEIKLENVHVPLDNRLAQCNSFHDTAKVLRYTRFAVVWEAIGLAAGCLELALKYAQEREQFGRPIAGFQLVQQKLVDMAAEVVQMRLLGYQLAQLMDRQEATEGMISLAKYNNAKKARQVAALAREVLGGNGVLIENHIARLLTDVEAVHTYEGTSEINMLIAGRALTGIGAFV